MVAASESLVINKVSRMVPGIAPAVSLPTETRTQKKEITRNDFRWDPDISVPLPETENIVIWRKNMKSPEPPKLFCT